MPKTRAIWLLMFLAAGCGSDPEDDSSLVGSYQVKLTLKQNTCRTTLKPTTQTEWEIREVAGKNVLVVESGGQLNGDSEGRKFSASIPVSQSGCAGTTSYALELARDGDQILGIMSVDIALTTRCDALDSCAYSYNFVGERS